MKKILIAASLILLLLVFGCLLPHAKSVKNLQNDYDRLQSLQKSLERELVHTQDPVKVENLLHDVELRMRYIEYEILRRQSIEQ